MKYLLICSVGIALALLGIFFLAVVNNNHQELYGGMLVKVISKDTVVGAPEFSERWYVLPLAGNTDADGFYYIESDALQRTFLRQDGELVYMQGLFAEGIETALPQERFRGGNDHSLQWELRKVK